MRVVDLQRLYNYNYWATGRMLEVAEALDDEQFTVPTRFPHGSLRGTLVHMLQAERSWLRRWQQASSRPPVSPEQYPTLAALVAQWRRDEAEVRAYIASLTDADAAEVLTIPLGKHKRAFTGPRWQFMAHIVNHGTQHRSEVAQMLTELGHSPGDFDLFFCFPAQPIEE